ncbi:putative protein-serine/threonine phosphatase [Helianthus annuus]|nr:putative protein-serine/threonine phosphatase [Helianthus annuus]
MILDSKNHTGMSNTEKGVCSQISEVVIFVEKGVFKDEYKPNQKHLSFQTPNKPTFKPFFTNTFSVNFDLPKMSFECHPGPLNATVLFFNKDHRVFEVFKNPENYSNPINIKRSDRSFWKYMKQHPVGPRVEALIRQAGFGGILDIGYRYIDHALITALVEGWRPETHMFHLPFGETTVTLQDVNVLWGLPIDGEPVSGADTGITVYTAVFKCQDLLGFTPAETQVKGKRVNLTRVLQEITSDFFENQASDQDCIIRARQIIFYLIGCTVLPDNANNLISVNFLEFLEDLPACSGYSWSSAVLSHLYRNLCNTAAPDAISVTGPISLIQVLA